MTSTRILFRFFLTLLCFGNSLGSKTAHAAAYYITNFCGSGKPGFSGDEGPAVAAQLNNPYGLCRGPDRALYICDMGNHRIRRVTQEGTISTVAGNGQSGYSGDNGPAMAASLNEPYEVRFDLDGNLFFVEMKNHVVRRVDSRTRRISTVAGTGGQSGFAGDDGPATEARLNQPHSIQFDSKGHLYICDIGNHRIRKVDLTTGLISTVAGTGGKGPTPDGASIRGTPLFGPRAIDFDETGRLWLALREGNAVYSLDFKSDRLRHVAGTGSQGFTGHGGPALLATLSGPKGLSIGSGIYLADTESHSIRMIDTKKGTLEWIAGTGQRGDGPPGEARHCALSRPHGVFVDTDGAVFIGDSEAHRIRVIRPGP